MYKQPLMRHLYISVLETTHTTLALQCNIFRFGYFDTCLNVKLLLCIKKRYFHCETAITGGWRKPINRFSSSHLSIISCFSLSPIHILTLFLSFFFFSLYHFSVDTFNVPSWLFEVEMQEDAGPGSSTFLSILAEMSFSGLGTVLAHVQGINNAPAACHPLWNSSTRHRDTPSPLTHFTLLHPASYNRFMSYIILINQHVGLIAVRTTVALLELQFCICSYVAHHRLSLSL